MSNLIEAVLRRLDTRCIKWPMHFPSHQQPPRCGDCDGCLADRWVKSGREATS